MPLITQGKTNWKFLLIVIILAIIICGGALWYARRPEKPYQPVEIKKLEDKTASFTDYTNKKMGFSFKYPPGWYNDGAERPETDSPDNLWVGFWYDYEYDSSGIMARRGPLTQKDLDELASLEGSTLLDKMAKSFEIDASKHYENIEYLNKENITIDGIPFVKIKLKGFSESEQEQVETVDAIGILDKDFFQISCITANGKDDCGAKFDLVLSTLKVFEKEGYAFLGVVYQDIASLTSEEKKKIGLSEGLDYGALIINEELAKEVNNPFVDASDPKNGIFPGSPAEKAGLKAGDIILEINGEKIVTPLYKEIDKYAPGDKVNLKILRDGKEMNVDLTFAEMPEL